ncbi:hypothetical protein [Lentzea sp. NPDC059081]|uniref:hypothetical protein n=1 Tax=Lentzea sp. NPDC059081 TaxID=3346719 RepID=UPI0036B371F6
MSRPGRLHRGPDYARTGVQIDAACPELTNREGSSVVFAAGAFVGRLYPLSQPPPAPAELYAREPGIAAVFPPFRLALQRFIAATAATAATAASLPAVHGDSP